MDVASPAANEDEFKLVGRRHNRRKAQPAPPRYMRVVPDSNSRVDPPVPLAARAVADALAQVECASACVLRHGSFLIEALVDSILAFANRHPRLPEAVPRLVRVSSLGIGSIHNSSNTRIQLAVLLGVQSVLLKEHMISLTCTHTDPALDDIDVEILSVFGHCVAPCTFTCEYLEPGSACPESLILRAGSGATDGSSTSCCTESFVVYYMVHCNTELYNDVLRAHWGPELERICIVGNSFRWIGEQRGASACSSSALCLPSLQRRAVEGSTAAPVPVMPGTDACPSDTPHVDVATRNVICVPVLPSPRCPRSCAAGDSASSSPVAVFERHLGATPRDRDREYQNIYLAFDATSVHTFEWCGGTHIKA